MTKISYKDALRIVTFAFNEYYRSLEDEEKEIFKGIDKTDSNALYRAFKQALPIRLELCDLEPIASSLNEGIRPDDLYMDALFIILDKSGLSKELIDHIYMLFLTNY